MFELAIKSARHPLGLLTAWFLILSSIYSVGWAEPFEEDKTGHQIVMEGNSRGATGCVACHGEQGEGQMEMGYPRLAGLPAPYLMAQLQAFRLGTRQSAVMQRIALALDETEMENVVAYYAQLKVPDTSQPLPETVTPEVIAQAKSLIYLGKGDIGLPACVRCHGKDAQGIEPVFPRLAGQSARYLMTELKRWRAGERNNDPIGLMQTVAKHLDEKEIESIAIYLASLKPDRSTAAGSERTQLQSPPKDSSWRQDLSHHWPFNEDKIHPPEENTIPKDEFGNMVLHGKRIFVATRQYAAPYVGNALSCVNCHLDRGRSTTAAPMGPAYVRYPRYRSKNHKVNTIEERIAGCFNNSLNGKAPEPLSKEMKALVSYFYFLSTDLPSGKNLPEAGYPKADKPPQPPDPQRGAQVYATNCAICHGANGQGTRIGKQYQFPPLWGANSFNWGAGMHRINTAAAFIRHNMPLGHPAALELQDVWDVAAYINSHDRPQDPRYTGSIEATRAKYHDHQCYYGQRPLGHLLGEM